MLSIFRATKHWGIHYKRSKPREDLPPPEFDSIPPVENAANNLPEFPVDINQAELLSFVGAAYANDLGITDLLLDLLSRTVEVLLSTDQRLKESTR